jgi:hypothetical protein
MKKTAAIFAVPSSDAFGFAWSWRCAADHTSSATSFAFYYDCMNDARRHGYDIAPVQAHGVMAPAGSTFRVSGPGA